jgi:hypothetical protein
MFQVLESTPDRLIIRMGTRPFQTTTVTFDRSKARFERNVFAWKRRPIEVPLDDIESITVIEQTTTGAQGMQMRSDNPFVQLKSGQRFWLSDPGSPAAAAEAVQLMRGFIGHAGGADAGTVPATTDQPIVAPHPSRAYRWLAAAVSVGALVIFLIIAGARLINWMSSLSTCDATTTQQTLKDIFEQKQVALTRLSDIKQVAAAKSERTCTAQAEITGGVLNLDYRLDWSGWSQRVTITRAEAEARIESAQLEEIKTAAAEFLSLAKDSPTNGRPPRQTEPTVADLLDKIFDLSPIEGSTLAFGDVAKANEWFVAGDRVGTVYILAGTGVSDINKLPADPNIQRRTHRNVVDFAPEFARYLDFQVKLAAAMMDAELSRNAKAANTLEQPEVKREMDDVRTTLTESMTGDLTTLAYDGITDDWRHERLKVLMQVAPRAATFVTADQRRALRDHALTVMTFVRDKAVQESLRTFAETIAPK